MDKIPVPASHKYALDFDAMLAHCRSKGYRCVPQDCQDLWQLPDESFDIVVTNQCLEHLHRTDHFFKEARRVLRTGGSLLVSVPNQGALFFVLLLALTINPPMNSVSDEYHGLAQVYGTVGGASS